MTKFIPKSEEPLENYSLHTAPKAYPVGETIALHLSNKTFSDILAYLHKLRTHVQDEQVANDIGVLLNNLVNELTPNEQTRLLSYFLKVSPEQATEFIAMQKRTPEENS